MGIVAAAYERYMPWCEAAGYISYCGMATLMGLAAL